MGLLTAQIADLFRRAQQHYADARTCNDADTKRKLLSMADEYVRQAKNMQCKQEQLAQIKQETAR